MSVVIKYKLKDKPSLGYTIYNKITHADLSCVWLTDMLSKSLMKRITSSSNACLRAVFGYQIKDISTSDLHKEANILTPFQKAYYDKAVML